MSSPILFRATRATNSFQRPLIRNHRILLSPSLSLSRAYTQETKDQQQPTFQDPLNPPHTTRPAPLNLPERDPEASAFKHYFSLGKAYLTFYKTGLKNILANRKLAKQISSSSAKQQQKSRSQILTRIRYAHDIRRLPVFGLVLLICGEFTPFVVLLIPKVVPLTCRIPKQVDLLLGKEEERRKTLRAVPNPDETRNLAGNLGVVGYNVLPVSLLVNKIKKKVEFLRSDDEMIARGGGVKKLEAAEVRLACAARGISVLGKGERELRGALERWLKISQGKVGVKLGGDDDTVEGRIKRLIVLGEEKW
ncbi:hypothetical protein QBC43DRAFT_312919 [Cladorrhinum sp. PSN259]|nr:hypothetical protein QBC43DRAFT_312919 [Cladorrhinum sp. PSN259]